MGLGWRFIFLTYGCPIVSALFDENSILILLSCFCRFVKTKAQFVCISVFSILLQCLCLPHHHYHTVIIIIIYQSVQFSHWVVSDSLQPHGQQHTRPPCPSPTPRVYSNSSPLSWWCHATISSSVVPFSSHLQSFPVSGSFQISQLFTSGDQSIGVSASTSILPMNVQGWFPLGWTGWISLQSKGLSRVSSNTTVQSINSSALSFLYSLTLTSIHDYRENHSLD